ncbi:MAG: SpoIID/LytB domain-containing protein [Parachlamydiaceae bacterium]|nr:SpoIID/LytB domain-containing protein [Parachlamydiaceae bacterium]
MIVRILLCMLAFLPFSTSLQAGWYDTVSGYFQNSKPTPPPMIKVLIVHDEPGVVLEVKGKYKIFDPFTKEHISTRFVGKRQYIQALRDGIKWGEEFPGVHQLVIIPDDKSTTTLINDTEYKGSIYVYDVEGAISVVNLSYIEDYLSTLIASQYREPMPEEAFAALIIAARTTAYYEAENPKTDFWNTDGREMRNQNNAVQKQQNSIDRILQATRYMVMTTKPSQNGQISPFIADWKESGKSKSAAQAVVSQLSVSQVKELAQKGENAAQILSKAFPDTKIELIHSLN